MKQVYVDQANLYAEAVEPVKEIKRIKVQDVLPGDMIYLHLLGAGPYLVKDVQTPNHPAAKNSCKTIWACHFRKDYTDWVKFSEPLSYQFTQNHHEVELWDNEHTRETFGLAAVNPRRVLVKDWYVKKPSGGVLHVELDGNEIVGVSDV